MKIPKPNIGTLKKLLLILAKITTRNILSQSVEIINKVELENLPKGKIFAFIEPTTDSSQVEYVATILARDKIKKSNIEGLYFSIREKATKLGANCFKISSFEKGGSQNEAILILNCYVASETLLNQNTANHKKNAVFIFGAETQDDKAISFNVNDQLKEIKPETYFKFILQKGEELKISKGGITGATMWLNWEQNKQPAFYSLSGLGLGTFAALTSIGISIHTGRINWINNISFGLLLTQLLKQGNE